MIEPGLLEIKNASVTGHRVLDAETGEEVGKVVSSQRHYADAVHLLRDFWKSHLAKHRDQTRRA